MTMKKHEYAIGIDLGGTNVKYALIDNEGVFHFDGILPSMAEVSAEAVTGQLAEAVSQVKKVAALNGIDLKGVGIGTPGIVDETGRVVVGGAENIRGWENIALADRLEEISGLPVRMGNDANLMGLGETVFGAGRGASDVVFITVGTGIGGAVVIGGKLFAGYAGRGTELGHVPLIADGEKCACGSVGCLEHYASASALVRRFCDRMKRMSPAFDPGNVDGKYIVDLYRQGDAVAVESLDEHCDFLGHGIAGFINIFSPQKVVIGGGLSQAGEFYISKVREAAMKYSMRDCAVNTEIVAAELGNRAGCLGAASLVLSCGNES